MRDTHGNRIVAVFGGTGFVGRRIVKHLHDHEFLVRIASRHPDRARVLFDEEELCLQPMMADIHDDAFVAAAIAGGQAAGRIARHASDSGVMRLVHISGIGADSKAHSPYIGSRGQAKLWSRPGFPDPIIVRSAAMFGPGDSCCDSATSSPTSSLSDVRSRKHTIAASLR
jgi:NADH dehydrogenase